MDTVTTKIISKDILDPFEVITEEALYDLILQHLSGKEIIELSTVSHRYDEVISKSRHCLDKISLVIDEETTKSDFYDHQREYRHLRVNKAFHIPDTYKSSKVKNQKLVEILRSFSSSLISIEIKTLLTQSNDVLDVTFDKLDDLKIMGLNTFIVNCFTTAPVLKSLSIMFTMMSHDELIKFIGKFSTIEHLQFKYSIFDRLFVEDISEKLKLSLKSLIVQKASEGRTIIDENFEIFLKTQMRTLEDIEFHDVADAETLNFIFKELRMKKLTVNRIDEPNQLNPRINAHITELVIKSDSKCSSLILASPNLHKLHVQRMNKSLLEFLCQNPNLRTVTFCQKEDDIETIEELYRSLSNDSANIYNEAIQFIQT